MYPQRTTRLQLDPGQDAASRRRHGRVRCDQTRCTFGTVLDMSASGMRVLIKGRPQLHVGSTVPLLIEISDGALVVHARVVWRTKVGFRRHVAGIEFVEVTPELRRHLLELASSASNEEYIREGIDPAARSA